MAGFAARSREGAAGALSPCVYWWRRGALVQLSSHARDGGLRIVVDGEFTEALNRLVELPAAVS
ncbi:hypothetical protein [Kitasatospora viridis]|uniref:Uncharacterized protein n=1 Tax=Kitasatospora viridis TaxID=281105 RepID=A0A561TTG0_9ACTN|nr:hypothetical protein [Kitasatospora viridis]TWF90406.1 hypothetical protein FHX73_13450 [Kitasatospora viridis]